MTTGAEPDDDESRAAKYGQLFGTFIVMPSAGIAGCVTTLIVIGLICRLFARFFMVGWNLL